MAKKRVALTGKEFQFLHDSLLKKFEVESDGDAPTNVRQLYGFAAFQEDSPNLKKSLEENPDVVDYLSSVKKDKSTIETRYSLYQNLINLKKEPAGQPFVINLDWDVFHVFLRYLGHASLEKFRETLLAAQPRTHYKMKFYSILFHREQECDLWVDYATSPIEVEMRGFHIDAKNPPYRGIGIKKGNQFYINLECESRGGEEFHIICNSGTVTNPEQWDVMPASFMGLSTQGVPTCGEAVISKVEDNEFNTSEGKKRLRGMIMLKRNRFIIKSREIRSLQMLTAHGTSVNDWDQIVGTYKVLGFDRTGLWHQSQLVIDRETYQGTYYTKIFGENVNLKELRAEISISNIISRIVCITTKSRSHTVGDIVSCVMVDFGALQHEETAIDASFVTVSRHTGKSVGGKIVMIKTKENFEVKELSEAEKQELIEKYSEARQLNENCEDVMRRRERRQTTGGNLQ